MDKVLEKKKLAGSSGNLQRLDTLPLHGLATKSRRGRQLLLLAAVSAPLIWMWHASRAPAADGPGPGAQLVNVQVRVGDGVCSVGPPCTRRQTAAQPHHNALCPGRLSPRRAHTADGG